MPPEEAPDPYAARLIQMAVALRALRDSLTEMSLQLREWQFQHDAELRALAAQRYLALLNKLGHQPEPPHDS